MGKLPQGSEQAIQMPERGIGLFLAQVTPAHRRMQAHAHLAGTASGALVAAPPRAGIGIGALPEVEHEAVGGVLQLLRQLAIVALDPVDQRHQGELRGEGEVESVEAHRRVSFRPPGGGSPTRPPPGGGGVDALHPSPAPRSCRRSDSPQGWHEPAERRDHVSPGRPPLTVTATGADAAAGPAAASGPAPATPNLITDANLCLSRRYRAAPTQVIEHASLPGVTDRHPARLPSEAARHT